MAVIKFEEKAAKNLEKLYMTPDVVAQRDDTLARLDLAPGERVIDIGCGPGFLCQSMADQVGKDGAVLGLDISEDLIALASGKARPDWLSYALSDALELKAKDNAFDAAVCTQVLEYVGDVDRGLREIHRVLKPGGRILIVDTEYDTCILSTGNLDLWRRILAAWEGHGSDPRLPRTLAHRLAGAGFSLTGVSVYAIINRAFTEDSFSFGMLGLIRDFTTRKGVIEQGEFNALEAELRELDGNGQYFFSLNRYIFEAVKS